MLKIDLDSLIDRLEHALEYKNQSKYIALNSDTIVGILIELRLARKRRRFIKDILSEVHDN